MEQEPTPIFTIALVVIIGFVSYLGFKNESFFEKYKFEIEGILGRKQYYRLFSSAFLHADIGHLIFNLFCFYSFAEGIELRFGRTILIAIYFLSLLGGDLLSLWFHRNHHDYSAVGASGAVCGVMFASIFLLPGGKIEFFLFPIGIPASIFSVLYIIISIYGIKAQRDNIGHEAHLGGAITGMLVALAVYPQIVLTSLWQFIIISFLVVGFIMYFGRNSLLSSVRDFKTNFKNITETNRQENNQRIQEELDGLLDKVRNKGFHSLSKRERERLQTISNKMQKG